MYLLILQFHEQKSGISQKSVPPVHISNNNNVIISLVDQ